MATADAYENDNWKTSAKPITLNSIQYRSLTNGDYDYVYFDVTTAGTYTIEVGGSQYALAGLYEEDMEECLETATGGESMSYDLTAGRYYIFVCPYAVDEVDSYSLRLTSNASSPTTISADSYENDNSRFKAKTISVGSTQNRSLHSSTDEDWIKFTVAEDGFYSVVTSGGDTILQLYSFENQAFGYNDDRGNGNLGSFGVCQLYANTTYYARVTAYNGKTFNYNISVTKGVVADTFESNSDNSRTSTSTTLSVGSTQVHTIHSSSDVDWMKVNITEDGLYFFSLGTSERDAGQMLLYLYDSDGDRLINSNCQKESGENPFIAGRLSAGTYYLKAAAANSGSIAGEYSVNVSKVSSLGSTDPDQYEDDGHHLEGIANAATITVGTPQTHSLSVFQYYDSIDREWKYSGDVDYIKFTPTQTGTYKIAVTGTNAPSTMTIYAADEVGFPTTPTAGNSKINPFVENYMHAGQTYFIKMESDYTNLNIDSYTISVTMTSAYNGEQDTYESDNTVSSAKTITVGSTQAHSIHNTSDVDWVKFTPTSSGYYTFYTGARNGNAGDADMLLGLYDARGKLLIYDDDSFAAYSATLSYNMTADQTYYLVAMAARNNAVVPYYTLSVASGIIEDTYDIYMDERSIVDDTREKASVISVGQAQVHTIHDVGDVDWVSFTVDTTGNYTIQTEGTGDTIISVYDKDGNFLLLDDDSGVGRNASVKMRFVADTRYYAKVYSYQNALIPNYTLSLTEAGTSAGDAYESDNTISTAKGIVAGETQSHSIHTSGDVDWVKIRPIQTGTYQIQTSGDGDLKLDLYASNGTTLLATDDDSGVGLNARLGYVLNANTDYYIKAYTYNTSTLIDNYGLSIALMVGSELGDEFENDDSPNNAKSITLGTTQSHSIHIAGDVDWVTFTPTVSAEYTIQTVGSGLNCDTQLYLYTSLANARANNYLQWDDDGGADRNAMISRVLTAGTTYYIKARAWDTYTIPSYGLKITQNNGVGANSSINGDEYENDNLSGDCKPIAVGREYTHSIHVQSDTDWVRFFTHQTGMYTIQTTGDSDTSFIVYKRIPGGALVPYENGEEITGGGAAQNAGYRVYLETNNWYYVRITTENRATTSSSYGIRVDIDSSSVRGDSYETLGGKTNDNAPSRANWLTLGYKQQHSIHTPGDTDWIVYKAANSAEVVFSAENDDSKEMRLFFYRKESNGNLTYLTETSIGSYGYTASTLSTTAGNTYYVRAQALSSTQTIANYSLVATYVKDAYENDDTSSKATVLSIGSNQTHNIHSQTDEDWFKFVVTSAGTYEFETSGSGDTYGILYRNTSSGNTVVTQSNSGGSGQNMKINTSLTAGTYYLRITGYNKALVESYSITARRPITQYDEPNNSTSAATALDRNGNKTGSFHSTSDVDYFKIANAAAGTYQISTNSSAITIELTAGNRSVSGRGSASITLDSSSTVYAKLYNSNGDLMEQYTVSSKYSAPVQQNKAENYVVLFAGGGGVDSNAMRYHANFVNTYEFLVENYSIPRDHIYVLYADGTNRNGDFILNGTLYNSKMDYANGSHIYEASQSNLQRVMNELATKTDSNDHMLVYVYDHGGDPYDGITSQKGQEVICPWDFSAWSDGITGQEFNSMISSVNAGYQTYLFAQCYAGGILDALNFSRSGIKMYGAAADNHYSPSTSRVNTETGIGIGGFAYEVMRAFYDGVENTGEFYNYVVTENYSYRVGKDAPYQRGNTNFQIFAQS